MKRQLISNMPRGFMRFSIVSNCNKSGYFVKAKIISKYGQMWVVWYKIMKNHLTQYYITLYLSFGKNFCYFYLSFLKIKNIFITFF